MATGAFHRSCCRLSRSRKASQRFRCSVIRSGNQPLPETGCDCLAAQGEYPSPCRALRLGHRWVACWLPPVGNCHFYLRHTPSLLPLKHLVTIPGTEAPRFGRRRLSRISRTCRINSHVAKWMLLHGPFEVCAAVRRPYLPRATIKYWSRALSGTRNQKPSLTDPQTVCRHLACVILIRQAVSASSLLILTRKPCFSNAVRASHG